MNSPTLDQKIPAKIQPSPTAEEAHRKAPQSPSRVASPLKVNGPMSPTQPTSLKIDVPKSPIKAQSPARPASPIKVDVPKSPAKMQSPTKVTHPSPAKEKATPTSSVITPNTRSSKRLAAQDDNDADIPTPAPKKAKIASSKTSKMEETVLKVGDVIQDATVTNQDGVEVTLHQLVKDNGAVFFIYPKANTPGCTTQACGFRDNYAEFQKKGYKVYGLSTDTPSAQLSWKTKKMLPFDLLCDPELKAISSLGCQKGPKSVKRSHVVVGKNGVVEDLQIQVSPAVSIAKSLEFVTSRR